jgi:rod shape-determining protein MreD
MSKRKKAAKYTCCCLFIAVCALLQNVQGLMPEIHTARCFLLIPAAVILAMGEDERTGALLGLFAGLLWDITSGVHMGFNCIYLAVMCFLASALTTYLMRDIFVTALLASGVATVLYCILYWLLFIIIRGVDGGELTILTFYAPCAVYTVAVSALMYFILRPFKKLFTPEEKKTPEF